MNRDSLHDKIIRVAQNNSPDHRVPYAFEKRVMARILARVPDKWAALDRVVWWAAGACSAVALSMGVWASLPGSPAENTHSFSTQLEQTILASVSEPDLEADLELGW